jgi:hypothetical protein
VRPPCAADEDWQSITNPLAREDQRRYEGVPWDELTTDEETTSDHDVPEGPAS